MTRRWLGADEVMMIVAGIMKDVLAAGVITFRSLSPLRIKQNACFCELLLSAGINSIKDNN